MTDKMREAFEAWAKATSGWDLYPFGTDQYADHKTNAAWFAWQAALAQAEQPPTGLEPHHLAAIDRAAAILDARADQYMKAGDYSCELEEADAKSLREVSAWIVRQAERQSPQSSLQWDDCPEKTQYGEGMMEAFVELSKDETMRLVAHNKALALIPAALSRLVAPVVPPSTTKEWCTTMAKLEAGHSVTAGCYAKPLADACRLPSDGWLCTREPGHDGPCAAVFHAPPAPAVPAWRQFPEQVPDPDTECLVEVAFNGALYRAVDTWEMQRYMPVEWSSATVEIGYGWSAHDDVQRWIPISSIAATPAPVAPDDVVKDAARYRWLRDCKRIPRDSTDGHIVVSDESGEDILWGSVLDRAIDAAAPEVKP